VANLDVLESFKGRINSQRENEVFSHNFSEFFPDFMWVMHDSQDLSINSNSKEYFYSKITQLTGSAASNLRDFFKNKNCHALANPMDNMADIRKMVLLPKN